MTTWNPSSKGPNITLSGGNLTATPASTTGTSSLQYVISTTSKSSGKWVMRLTGNLSDGGTITSAYNQGGITTTNTSLDGLDASSYHFYKAGGDEYDLRNNSSRVAYEYPTTSFPTMFDGTDEVDIYLDLDNNLYYLKVNGTFFFNSEAADPDPTTPIGGIPIAGGTYFVYYNLYVSGASNAITMNPNPTGLPSGWLAWDDTGGGGGGVVGKVYETSQAINRASSW